MSKLTKEQKIAKALKNAKNVNVHKGSLRLHFKKPGDEFFTKISLGIPPTISNIETAVNKLAQIRGDIANGSYDVNPEAFWAKHFPTNTKNIFKKTTLADYFEIYRKENEGTFTFSTQNKFITCQNWVTQYGIIDLDIKEVNHRIINKLRTDSLLTRECSTVREYSQTLRQVLYEAVTDDVIPFDPFLKVKKIKNSGLELEDEMVSPFSQVELDQLVAAVHIPQLKLMILFLAWTGLRPGEMKALAWEDVDLDNRCIYVKYNLDREGKLKTPKTPSGVRKVDLLPIVIDVLQQQKEKSFNCPVINETIHYKNFVTKKVLRKRVFLSRDNLPYKRPELTTTREHWKRWIKEAGITYRPPYQLRHTYASRMLMVDAKPAWLAKQMGHKNWGLIQTIYAKWIDEQEPNYIDDIAKKLDQKSISKKTNENDDT